MADFFDAITDEQVDLIEQAPLFFVASADPALADAPNSGGPVNLSPKGGVPLHIIDRNRVAFLDYTGSGNETARHAAAGGPITVMVAAFDQENAAIVRLYGTATVLPIDDSPLAVQLKTAPATEIALPERQVIDIQVTRTMTSCGYGVPVMSFEQDRTVKERGRRYKQTKTAGA